jgi:hypothetical protein
LDYIWTAGVPFIGATYGRRNEQRTDLIRSLLETLIGRVCGAASRARVKDHVDMDDEE